MSIHHCIEKCAVGGTYLLTTKHTKIAEIRYDLKYLFSVLSTVHAKVANSNPTNYIFLRLAINTVSIEYIKILFFQNLKIGLECLL